MKTSRDSEISFDSRFTVFLSRVLRSIFEITFPYSPVGNLAFAKSPVRRIRSEVYF